MKVFFTQKAGEDAEEGVSTSSVSSNAAGAGRCLPRGAAPLGFEAAEAAGGEGACRRERRSIGSVTAAAWALLMAQAEGGGGRENAMG
mmetsp:Transcript_61652/g.201200  ORF Transcript_61652/g.201200 Transcript_61652/m.201200 type:complete len:88 (+) Transcript_61652:1454-1717(+)